MRETEQATEPAGSEDTVSRKRASPLKRYGLTVASAIFRPRHLRKENYDPTLVFGPVVFSFITLIGFSLIQLILWQRDPLAATFEFPDGLSGAGTTISDIRSELAFLPWTPVVLLSMVVLGSIPLYFLLRSFAQEKFSFAAFLRPYVYSQVVIANIGIALLVVPMMSTNEDVRLGVLVAILAISLIITVVYVIPEFRRITQLNFVVIAIAYFAYNSIFTWTVEQLVPVRPFSIKSTSMLPNLEADDIVAVNRWAYFWRKPERGEIMIFQIPADPETYWVKRIVGLPGEQVSLKDGKVYIDDTAGSYERIDDFIFQNRSGDQIRAAQYIEKLPGGARHTVLDRFTSGRGDNTQTFEVPADHYFVLGDYRDNSNDSRFALGLIPEDELVGPVYSRLLPLGRKSLIPPPQG